MARRKPLVAPPVWDKERLEADRRDAIETFRKLRMEEPLDAYLEAFDQYRGVVEELLESTVDLGQLDANGLAVLTDPKLLTAFRYLSGPPISGDDLKTLVEGSLSPGWMPRHPAYYPMPYRL